MALALRPEFREARLELEAVLRAAGREEGPACCTKSSTPR
jgi:hypothetical protein